MNRSLAFHLVALLLSIVVALWAWTDQSRRPRDAPVLLAAQADEVTAIRFQGEHGSAVFTPEFPGYIDNYIVEFDPTDPAAETLTFPAGPFVVGTLNKLLPLQPRRSLGKLSADRLATMGLDPPRQQLTVSAAGKRVELEIGNSAYGNASHYTRVRGEQDIHILDGASTRMLAGPVSTLMEPRIVHVPPAQITAMTITLRGRSARFVHRYREQFRKRYFAPEQTRDSANEAANQLLIDLRLARTKRYQVYAPITESPELEIELEREKLPPQRIQLWSKPDDGFRLRGGRWLGDISAVDGQKLLDGAQAVINSL